MDDYKEVYDRLLPKITEDNKMEILAELAENGLGMIYGHKMLRQGLRYPMNECKRIVFTCGIWKEDAKLANKLHDVLEEIED